MNPSIPPEFFLSAHYKALGEVEESEGQETSFPKKHPGAYSHARVLPLRIFIIQRLLENPDLLTSQHHLPEDIRDFFLNRFTETGRLSIHNVGPLSQNAEALDWSYLPGFSAQWLQFISKSQSLTTLHLIQVAPIDAKDLIRLGECPNLTEISLGPRLTGDFTQVGSLLSQISALRLYFNQGATALMRDILSQLNSDQLRHIDIISATPVLWDLIELHCGSVDFLAVSRFETPITDDELENVRTHLPKISQLTYLLLDYDHDFSSWIDFASESWPALQYVWMGNNKESLCLKSYAELQTKVDIMESRLSVLEFDIKIFRPLPLLLDLDVISDNLSSQVLEGWVTELRYAIHHPTTLKIFLDILIDADFEGYGVLLKNSMTIPILSEILRIYSKQDITVFGAVANTLRALLTADDPGHSSLLQLIFENNRAAIEDAIDGCNIFGENNKPLQPKYDQIHLELFGLIGCLAALPPDDRYPARLCLSNSPKIIDFVCKPWQRLSSITLDEFTLLFSSLENVPSNGAFCDKLHDSNFVLNVEEALDLWAPMTRPDATLDDFAVDSAPNFGEIPQILTAMSPQHLRRIYFNHFSCVLKILRLIPYSGNTDWIYPICSWSGFHASFGPPPNPENTFCNHLEHIMQSYRVNRGHVTGHLVSFMCTFCKVCRSNFVEKSYHSTSTKHVIPYNLITYMGMRKVEDSLGYAKPISGWVLETKANFERWLDLLKFHCESEPRLLALSPLNYFEYLTRDTWNRLMLAIQDCPKFQEDPQGELPWELSLLLENFAIFSQLPLSCDLLLNGASPTITDWLIDMHLLYGQPAQTLSALYHLTCFRESFVPLLATLYRPVKRTGKGGRLYEPNESIPFRLIEPLMLLEDANEDMLSVFTETLFAGLTSFPDGTHVITLRILSNFSYFHELLHHRMQSSKSIANILEHIASFIYDEGSILGRLSLAVEIYSDAHQEVLDQLPITVRKFITKTAIFHSITAAENSFQPWWECLEAFLLRSIFRRGLHLILSCYSDPSIIEASEGPVHLGQQDVEDLRFLVEANIRVSTLEDISTQEIAFQSIEAALSLGEDPSDSLLNRASSIEQRRRFQQIHCAVRSEILHLLRSHEPTLREQAEFEHFGYTSKAVDVLQKARRLWKSHDL